MRCGVCRAPLSPRGSRRKEYRDPEGRVYKTLHHTVYHPCPRLDDAEAHPARHFPPGLECAWCGGPLDDEPERCRNDRDEAFCRPAHRTSSNRALRRLIQATESRARKPS